MLVYIHNTGDMFYQDKYDASITTHLCIMLSSSLFLSRFLTRILYVEACVCRRLKNGETII